MRFSQTATALAAALCLAAPAFADGHGGNPAVNARKGQMAIQAHTIGILAGMAREQMPFDAEAAQQAARALSLTGMMPIAPLWPEGTSSAELEESRALPAIWENLDDYQAKMTALADAAAAAEGVTSLGELQAAIGPIGGTCGACHRLYRESE